MRLTSLLPLLGAALASAAKLTISVPPSPPALPNPGALPPSTHATLYGAPGTKFSAPLRRDNTLVFENLPAASYLLTIHTRDHVFPPYRVDVTSSAADTAGEKVEVWQTFRGNEWNNKGPQLGHAQHALTIEARPAGIKEFYQQRGGFNILGFLKSPMILMGLVSVVFIFGMPYMMENSEAAPATQWRIMRIWTRTDLTQWTQRPRPSSRRCRRAALSEVQAVLRTKFRISIWRVSCQESRMLRLARKDDSCFSCRKLKNTTFTIHAISCYFQSDLTPRADFRAGRTSLMPDWYPRIFRHPSQYCSNYPNVNELVLSSRAFTDYPFFQELAAAFVFPIAGSI